MNESTYTLKLGADCVQIYGERAKAAALADNRELFVTEMLNALHAIHTALAAERQQGIANHE